jgi:hypothetical protein
MAIGFPGDFDPEHGEGTDPLLAGHGVADGWCALAVASLTCARLRRAADEARISALR